MATTNKIQDTLNWCAAYTLNRPSSGVAGVASEPGLTNANLIMSTILAPPFAWQWNRSELTFNTVVGQADYFISVPQFGWLEKATRTLSTAHPPVVELQIAGCLSAAGKQGVPFQINPFKDDNAGNLTFRLMSIPDDVYTMTLTYQRIAPLLTALTQTWAPIPDKYNFLYERGMLAHLHAMYDAATYGMELQLFFRQLVGCSEGLSDTAKAIFLEDRLAQIRTEGALQSALTAAPKRAQ